MPILTDADIDDVANYAKKHGFGLYAAHPRGNALPYDLDLGKKFCLVLGNESQGLTEAANRRADALIRLPMGEGVESLSVAAAGSIIMYEAVRQRGDALAKKAF